MAEIPHFSEDIFSKRITMLSPQISQCIYVPHLCGYCGSHGRTLVTTPVVVFSGLGISKGETHRFE